MAVEEAEPLSATGGATCSYLDLQSCSEGHFEGALQVFGEDSLEGLLEERRVERVGHHHVAPGGGAIVSVSVCEKMYM